MVEHCLECQGVSCFSSVSQGPWSVTVVFSEISGSNNSTLPPWWRNFSRTSLWRFLVACTPSSESQVPFPSLNFSSPSRLGQIDAAATSRWEISGRRRGPRPPQSPSSGGFRSSFSPLIFAGRRSCQLCALVRLETHLPSWINVRSLLHFQIRLCPSVSMDSNRVSPSHFSFKLQVQTLLEEFELLSVAEQDVARLQESARRRLLLALYLIRDPGMCVPSESASGAFGGRPDSRP